MRSISAALGSLGIVAMLCGPALAQQDTAPEADDTVEQGTGVTTGPEADETTAPTTGTPLMQQQLPGTQLPATEMPSSELPSSELPSNDLSQPGE